MNPIDDSFFTFSAFFAGTCFRSDSPQCSGAFTEIIYHLLARTRKENCSWYDSTFLAPHSIFLSFWGGFSALPIHVQTS